MRAVVRIVLNALLMIAEIAAVAAVAWIGYRDPIVFAALTFVLALGVGIALEVARARHELPFYFGTVPVRAWIIAAFAGGIEAVVKALLAGVVALLTFLGTDSDRLFWVATGFGVCLFIGCQIVRALTWRLDARPLRWGYFRLAAPLGILFSLGLATLPSPGLTELASRLTFELPERPTLAQTSEFLFLIKQSFDDLVTRAIATVIDGRWADVLGALVSTNMLTGFVLALYAVLIAEAVRVVESRI
jgi:hypothetical protein